MNNRRRQAFALLVAVAVCAPVLAQGSKWGEPLPDPRSGAPATSAPKPARHFVDSEGRCIAHRTKGAGSFVISCSNLSDCEHAKTAARYGNEEIVGCANEIHCFAYGGSASNACYYSRNECASARLDMARRGSKVGDCVLHR